MALAQAQFERFHETIKCTYENNSNLREKRDFVISELKDKLPKNMLPWSSFNLGSYFMKVGIIPLNRFFTIDIGINFDASPTEYEDPLEIKKIIRNSLIGHDRNIEINHNKLTIDFIKNQEIELRAEVSIYTNEFQRMYLAIGADGSDRENRSWCHTKPAKLVEYIKNCHQHESADQFRRVVRYITRWRDKKFKSNCVFTTIAITVATAEMLEPNFHPDTGSPRDIYAILNLVQALQKKIIIDRGNINLPISPYINLMDNLTDEDHSLLKRKLKTLETALLDALYESNDESACRILRGQFGKDFPVPENSGTPDTSNNIYNLNKAKNKIQPLN